MRAGPISTVLTLLWLAGACSGSTDVEQAQQRWENRSQGDYELVFENVCDCPAHGLVFEVTFRDNEPTTGHYRHAGRKRELTPTALQLTPTVDELFSLVDDGAAFDEETGVPSEVRRGDTTFRNIRIEFDLETQQATLEEVSDAWDERTFDDYKLTYRCLRGCAERGRITVEWRDGTLVSETDTRAAASMEELLELAAEALAENPGSIDIRKREDGFLRRATIKDEELGMILDVRSVVVTALD